MLGLSGNLRMAHKIAIVEAIRASHVVLSFLLNCTFFREIFRAYISIFIFGTLTANNQI